MKNININLPRKYKPLLFPLGVIVVILASTFTVGMTAFDKLQEVRSKINNFEQSNKNLEEKRDYLATLSQDELSKQSEVATSAIPAEESTMLLLASLKSLANSSNVSVSDFNLAPGDRKASSARPIKIGVSISGSLTSTLSFIDSLKSSYPLMRISKLGFTVSQNKVRSDFSIDSYWSPLPTTISSTDTPLQNLRSSDQQLLTRLGELKKPASLTYTVLQPQGRENPFSY